MSTRREFIRLIGVSGGALVLGVGRAGAQGGADAFRPNAWLRIEPDGSVVIKVGKSEMGQGVRTALPMIVAEELDVDFASVRVEQAQPGPDFRSLGTGGSRSVMTSWAPLRKAGAAARTMLVGAAAVRWGVPAAECTTDAGAVVHAKSGKRTAYRDLIADAAKQPVPETLVLKRPAEFRLIGRSRPRVDGADIVTGRARYDIDVRLPGMRFAVVARPAQPPRHRRRARIRRGRRRGLHRDGVRGGQGAAPPLPLRQPLRPDRRARAHEAAARSLDYSHRKGVVHLAIKPANLMVLPGPVLKVMDFGIARIGPAEGRPELAVDGTPTHMAPERIVGQAADARADVWSCGVILYELVTGQNPFHADTASAVMYKVLQVNPDPPSALHPSLPAAIDAVVARALANSPRSRMRLVNWEPIQTVPSSTL